MEENTLHALDLSTSAMVLKNHQYQYINYGIEDCLKSYGGSKLSGYSSFNLQISQYPYISCGPEIIILLQIQLWCCYDSLKALALHIGDI